MDLGGRRYTLTISCPDRVGIVAAVSAFIAGHRGWILEANHHSDHASQWFFMRHEILAESLPFGLEEFRARFAHVERGLARRGKTLPEADLEEMEGLWQQAKG